MPQQNVTQFYGSCSSLSTKVSHPIPSALHFGWLKLPQDRCHQHHPRMELAPYGKQQGRRRESEGWKLNRRGKDHQWWKISSLPSRELTYPTLGKGQGSSFSKVPLEWDMLVPRRVRFMMFGFWWTYESFCDAGWYRRPLVVGCVGCRRPHTTSIIIPRLFTPEPLGRRTISCLADPLTRFWRNF